MRYFVLSDSIFIFSWEIRTKWNISRLFLIRLLLNHLKNSSENFSKNAIKSSVLLEIIYGFVLSESFAVSISFNIKRKSVRNWLEKEP